MGEDFLFSRSDLSCLCCKHLCIKLAGESHIQTTFLRLSASVYCTWSGTLGGEGGQRATLDPAAIKQQQQQQHVYLYQFRRNYNDF